MRLFFSLAFLFLSISFSVSAQNYPLEVEAYQVHTTTEGLAELDGMTTYRFYITNLGPNDFITSIYGNDQVHFELSVPGGIYNSSYNSSWSASGISQVFVDLFPELEYDSYATIGLTQSASTSGIAGAADPSLSEDPTQRLSSMFLTDGSVGGTINSVSGFLYYILNNSNNTAGLPDVDGRVLIMQITTSGALSGTLNALIFPESVGSDYVMATYMFDGAGLYAASGDCVADTDGDGICDIYDNCIGSYDECGICDGDGIQEGECDCNGNQFDECGVCGGTGIPAGDCDCDGNQLDAINVCGGDCQSDDNNNGICDINDCNPESFCGPGTYWNEDTETCLISIITDTNLDGCTDLNDLMDILSAYGDCAVPEIILGCMDDTALNFNPDATEDDGSCEYIFQPSEVDELVFEYYLNFTSPSSCTTPYLEPGEYYLEFSGTYCYGSCWGGNVTDAAFNLHSPYSDTPDVPSQVCHWTWNEYCPQGGDTSCASFRPTPDVYNPDHIYYYPFTSYGGAENIYGISDECCWGDNSGGLTVKVFKIVN